MKLAFRIVAGVLATLALLMGTLWAATRLSGVQEFLATEAARVVGPEVHFERIGIVFWPGLGISLVGVRITEDDSQGSQEVLTADDVGLIFDFSALLGGKLELDTIVFSGANLLLRRAPDGTFSFSNLVGRFAQTTEEEIEGPNASFSGRLPAIKGRDSSFLFVDISADGSQREVLFEDVSVDVESSKAGEDAGFEGEVVLGDGQIHLEGTMHRNVGDPSVLDGPIEVDLKGAGLPAHTILHYVLPGEAPQGVRGLLDVTAHIDGTVLEKFRGSGHLQLRSGGSFEWLGFTLKAPLEFSLEFEAGGSHFSMPSGKLHASSVFWDKLQASDLSVQMQYTGGALHLSDAKLTFYEGDLNYSGSFRFDDAVSYRGKVQTESVSMTALLTDLTGSIPDVGFDTLQTSFEFEGAYRGGEDALQGARGSGRMRLEGGIIPSTSVIGAVGGGLLSVIPSALKPSSRGKSVDPTEIEYLEQSFELGKGVLQVSDLDFVTRDYSLTGNGSIGLDGHLDLSTELDFTIVGMQKLLITTAVPIPKTGVDILPGFPLFVTGTVSAPIFLPDIRKIPFMALQVFFSPVRGAAKLLFGGIRDAGSHLTSWMRPSS